MGRLEKILLVILIFASSLARLWRIPEYLTFLGDEGRDITVVRDIIKGSKYSLIGPGTSIGNMYLGPWYYYLMIPAVGLSNYSPIGPAVMSAGFGVATVALLWWISRAWFGPRISWFVSFLYALSPTVIIYSRSSWNPNIMPFFALLAVYSTWAIYRFQKYQFLLVLAFSLAMVLNSHYLGLLLLPPIGIFIWWTKKEGTFHKYLIYSLLLFFMFMSPLLIFDARHGWQNFQSFKKFITIRQETVNLKPYKAIPNLWPLYTQINSSLLLAKQEKLSIPLSILSIVSIILYAVRESKFKRQAHLILFWLGFGIIGLGLYKQHIYDHYFGFLFPGVFLSLAASFKFIRPKISLLLFSFILFLNLLNSPLLSEPNRQLQRTREISEFINSKNPNTPYNLALISNHNYDASYRYFLNNNYRTLHQQITDSLYVICESSPCDPINNPLWEIAGFGWAKIDSTLEFPWGVKLFRLVHNPTGKS